MSSKHRNTPRMQLRVPFYCLYVAKMTLTGGGDNPIGKGCPGSQSLGTGARVTWTPASGTYRLTAYGASARVSISRSHACDVIAAGAMGPSL